MTLNLGQAPVVSTTRDTGAARARAATLTEKGIAEARGLVFTASTSRPGVPVGNDYSSVIKAPADKFLVLEDVFFSLGFDPGIGSGAYSVTLDGYVDESAGNAWGYTPGTPVSLGRPLNAAKINEVADGTIDLGVTVAPAITGLPDYNFYFAEYFIDTGGNRNAVSSNSSTFFGGDRKIILKPGQEMLARTVTTGTAVGSASVRTLIFTSEVSIADAPKVLGATLAELGYTP
jgi:hypothetical protein